MADLSLCKDDFDFFDRGLSGRWKVGYGRISQGISEKKTRKICKEGRVGLRGYVKKHANHLPTSLSASSISQHLLL